MGGGEEALAAGGKVVAEAADNLFVGEAGGMGVGDAGAAKLDVAEGIEESSLGTVVDGPDAEVAGGLLVVAIEDGAVAFQRDGEGAEAFYLDAAAHGEVVDHGVAQGAEEGFGVGGGEGAAVAHLLVELVGVHNGGIGHDGVIAGVGLALGVGRFAQVKDDGVGGHGCCGGIVSIARFVVTGPGVVVTRRGFVFVSRP